MTHQLSNAEKAEIFARHAMPGMTLMRKPAPLIRRCTCGRPISNNKFWCRACRDLVIEQVAQGNTTSNELRAVLAQSTPDERAQIAQRLVEAADHTAAEGAD